MLKTIIPVFLLLFLAGCSSKTVYAPDEKAYATEDLDIFHALEYKNSGRTDKAVETYATLYKKSGKAEYLIEKIKLLIGAKRYSEAKTQILEANTQNIKLQRLLVLVYLKQQKLDDALKIALKNIKTSNSYIDYKVAADLYLAKKEYEHSFKYMQSAYAKNQTVETLMPMVKVLVSYLKKDADAIAYLQTHLKSFGFNEALASQLLAIYGKNSNVEGMKESLKLLYNNTKKDDYAKKLLSIYGYQNDSEGAIGFLEESGYNQPLLYDLYKQKKLYSKALDVAMQLYKDTANPTWLAQAAILQYDLEYPLTKIVQTFEQAIEEGVNDPMYLNYYGYILIDHELDIAYGIKLVKQALEQKPDSVYYIDSLAWGYYKQKKCKMAKKYLPRLEMDDSEEIRQHIKMIKRCTD